MSLKDPPKFVKIIVAILPSAVLVGAFVYFAILPKNVEIEQLNEVIAKQEADISKSQSMVQRLDELKAENERLRAQLAVLEEYLPEEKEISSLLKQVEELSKEAGLEILSWKPSPKRRHPSGVVFEIPVSVKLNGSYHDLGHFFSSLTQLDRIVNVKNIGMGNPVPKGDKAILSISFDAATFTAIPEAEEGAAGAQPAGKGKGKGKGK
ncbi:MAG: type 4a pilus biogenesis protein PilO [Nitrospirota bacterium]